MSASRRKTILMAASSLAALAISGTITASAASCNGTTGNLIANCGFETGDFTGWSGSATQDPYSGIAGIDPITQANPYEGSFQAVLESPDMTAMLYQTFATVPNDQYTIEFALANDYGAGSGYLNSFAATFGNSALASFTNAPESGYTLYTDSVIATGTLSTLAFTERNDAGSWDLDSISVEETPEPSSMVLLGTGLLGAVGAVRRRSVRN